MRLYVYLFLMIILFSCEKKEFSNVADLEDTTSEIITITPDFNQVAVIGAKQPNPYRLENMQIAYENLSPETRTGSTVTDIQATHKYVKFLPSCEADLIALQKDESLFYYLYPLDHDVSDGRLDVDPNFSINGFQHRWAYVPIDKDLSHIDCPYEVLYTIVSPEDVSVRATSLSTELLRAVEYESHRLCGMELEMIAQTRATRVTPSGRITFWDETKGIQRGCKGMSVWANRLTHESYGHCDEDGNFTCNDSFLYKWTYHVYFSRTDFEIRKDDSTSEIVYKFSGYKSALNLDYGAGTNESYYASILRAACRYYYFDIDGLRRPPMKSDNSAKLIIKAYVGSDPDGFAIGAYYTKDRWIFSDRPIVMVYRKGSTGVDRAHIDIYGTTIHELTHAVHWRMGKDTFDATSRLVKETLARGIQWYLTKDEDSTYFVDYYRQSYTGLIHDLVDGYKIRESSFYASYVDDELSGWTGVNSANKSYYDHVDGYDIVDVENAVVGAKTWAEWQNNLLNNYSHADENYVSNAFAFWNSI